MDQAVKRLSYKHEDLSSNPLQKLDTVVHASSHSPEGRLDSLGLVD